MFKRTVPISSSSPPDFPLDSAATERRAGNLWAALSRPEDELLLLGDVEMLPREAWTPVSRPWLSELQKRFNDVLQSSEELSMILERLREAGLRAYVLGGWVRDTALGQSPHDIDLVVIGGGSTELAKLLPKPTRRTALGGLAFAEGPVEVDLWALEDTFLIRQLRLDPTVDALMRVIDFNINTGLFAPEQFGNPFLLEGGLQEALRRREIDFHCGALTLPVAQVSRLAYFSAKLGFSLSARVKSFMHDQCIAQRRWPEVEANLRQYCPESYRDDAISIIQDALRSHEEQERL